MMLMPTLENAEPEQFSFLLFADALLVGANASIAAYLAAPEADLIRVFIAGIGVALAFTIARRKLNPPASNQTSIAPYAK